jgi:azurin
LYGQTVPISEGDAAPASAICAVRQRPEEPPASPPPNFRGTPPALPLVYLPRGLDNSSGGQAFVSSDRWGPLAGGLLHFSFGFCTHFLVLCDEVGGRAQGAVVPLPGDFRSGVHRGRFHPRDGQLYVSGMNGWGSYAVDDGCFQRVRYAGGTVQQPVRWRAHRNGVMLEFSAPLDAAVAGDAASHFAQCWNYRYGPGYGSPEFSPSHYGTVGHDPLAIRSATVLSDGRSLFLELPDIQPVNQLHLSVAVGPGTTRDVFATVHALDEPFRDIPYYQEVTRPVAAHPILRDVALMKAAVRNPWLAKLAGARPVTVEAASNLAYKTPELRAVPGETLALTLANPDVVPHNWVLAKPGTLDRVGGLADTLIADPEAVARHYVPRTDDVIASTDITPPGGRQTIFFRVPEVPGRYPFLCTFPGHWKLMNGTLVVAAAATEAPAARRDGGEGRLPRVDLQPRRPGGRAREHGRGVPRPRPAERGHRLQPAPRPRPPAAVRGGAGRDAAAPALPERQRHDGRRRQGGQEDPRRRPGRSRRGPREDDLHERLPRPDRDPQPHRPRRRGPPARQPRGPGVGRGRAHREAGAQADPAHALTGPSRPRHRARLEKLYGRI